MLHHTQYDRKQLMELIEYRELMRRLDAPQLVNYFPEGVSASLFVPGYWDSKQVDVIFAFPSHQQKIPSDTYLSVVALDHDGIFIYHRQIRVVRSNDSAPYTADHMTINPVELRNQLTQYRVLFVQIRQFCFADVLSETEISILQQYYHVFCQITHATPATPISTYQQCVPEFFDWMSRFIVLN